MKPLIGKTTVGIASFYLFCAVIAGCFYLAQGDSVRVSRDLLNWPVNSGYLESLKFSGLIFIAVFVLIELLVVKLRNLRRIYDYKDSVASLSIYIINVILAPITLFYIYTVLKWAEGFAVFQIGDGLFAFVITFLLFEGAYYWYHRLSHEIPLLWAIHHTHHSAQTLNFTIAFRLHTFGRLVSPLAYLPLIFLGFKPEYILAALYMSLIYQFFLHTQTVSTLGWIESTGFNTPSKHRVHHGVNQYCIDKNYGGMLIVWDKVYQTFAAETEQIRYGVSTGFYSYNPITLLFKPIKDWRRGKLSREATTAKSV